MIHRRLQKRLIHLLNENPSVALTGPRQVGKTTLALDVGEQIPSVYLDLENRLDRQKISDIISFHQANRDKLIILDEIQRIPELFSQLRGVIDKERREGNRTDLFLFLGSASLELLKQSGESLAGRITYLELNPIDVLEFAENGTDKLNELWLRGGFPESLLKKGNKDSLLWRIEFIKTYLERDIPQLGPRIPASTLERFWIMLAHNQGTTFNAAQMAKNLDVSGVTIARYLDLMVDLLLVRRLQPWTFNERKRLVKAPKVYVRDSGITHALLNIQHFNDLLAHPVVGGSWEGFVIENLLSIVSPSVRPYYYRTSGGAEIDLVLEFGISERWAIEIKRSSSPYVNRGFHTACNDIRATKKFAVYSGQDSFPMQNKVQAISLTQLMMILLAEIEM